LHREALLAVRAQPLRKKPVTPVFDDPAVYVWGGETVCIGGNAMGELSSVGWGWASGRCVELGCVRDGAAQARHAGMPVTVDLWGEAVGARAWGLWGPQSR
jgi:glycine cleavage system aminomethyltransferase T